MTFSKPMKKAVKFGERAFQLGKRYAHTRPPKEPRIRNVSSLLSRMRQQTWSQVPGCFGVPGLHRAEDWDILAKQCIQDCIKLGERIRSETKTAEASVLQHFDDLSDRLCSVLDVAELCRNVHPDPDFVEASNEAYMQVSSLTQQLNADHSIYEPLNALYERHERARISHADVSKHLLSDEDYIMVTSLKHDFERGGIRLRDVEKARLLSLQQDLDMLGNQFVNAENEQPPVLTIEEQKLRGLPSDVYRNLMCRPSSSEKKKPGMVDVLLHASNAQNLLKWHRDSAIREQVYRKIHDSDGNKTRTLDAILTKRHEIAGILGQKSFADLMFSGRLASSPEAVIEFLEKFSDVVGPNALQEQMSIERMKARSEPWNEDSSLHAWDRNYYIGRLKAQNFDLSSAGISRYFPLTACLSALTDVVQQVFGVRLQRINAPTSELWHHDVEKLDVIDERTGETLGHIYLDLFPRPGKYGHAAHFSIRCGRQIVGSSEYQTPIVALVCNFGKQSSSGHRLLSMSEYETLFHEFGHSLHSVLSRTRYQHLSGTRVATDLVEVPSHIFEHFAWDPRIIARHARHCDTGDEMPTRTVRSLCASRTGFVATDLQLQILFSAMDLHFHGSKPPIGKTGEAFSELQRRLTVMQADDGIAVPSTFHHFVSYGAGYYAYIFARILSAELWMKLFENYPYSRQGGDKLRHEFLALGASRDASTVISNLVSGEVTCEAFLEKMNVKQRDNAPLMKLPLHRPEGGRRMEG